MTLTPVQKFELALKAYGNHLPIFIKEHQFLPQRKFRFDYALPRCMLAIEIDGGTYLSQGGKHGTDRDREKLNLAAAMGWKVIRLSSTLLDDSEYCIHLIESALSQSILPPMECPVVLAQAAKQNAKARAKRAAKKADKLTPALNELTRLAKRATTRTNRQSGKLAGSE